MKQLAIGLLLLLLFSSCTAPPAVPNSTSESVTIQQNQEEEPMGNNDVSNSQTEEERLVAQRLKDEQRQRDSDYEGTNGYKKLVHHLASKNIEKELLASYTSNNIERFTYFRNDGQTTDYMILDKKRNKLFFGVPTVDDDATLPQQDLTPEQLEQFHKTVNDSGLLSWNYYNLEEQQPNVHSSMCDVWTIGVQFTDGTIVTFEGGIIGNPLDPNKDYNPPGYDIMHTYVKATHPVEYTF